MGSVTINPINTSNASGSFNSTSEGWVQGVFLDDPAIRNQLAGGYVASGESYPMWGGIGISEAVPSAIVNGGFTNGNPLGSSLSRATTVTAASGSAAAVGQLTGFTVFNQAHAMITSPQSPVPLAPVGGYASFFRIGSGARIVVAIDPVLVDAAGTVITSQYSWDFTNQMLTPYAAAWAANTLTGATYATTSGGELTFTTTTSHGVGVGAQITISGVVSTGAAAGTSYNGVFQTISGTSGSTIVVPYTVGNPGTYSSGGALAAGGGAANVKLIDVQIGNSMTVNFATGTGFATWNRSGSTGVILI